MDVDAITGSCYSTWFCVAGVCEPTDETIVACDVATWCEGEGLVEEVEADLACERLVNLG